MSRRHVLLTGATGLLGRYLLRDLLAADVPVAVLVRPGSRQSPQERVDALLANWEQQTGQTLPRPVVLEGDVCEPAAGLDDASVAWVRAECDAVLHNAASLSFETAPRHAEPWRSNLDGTRNVLELARATGLRGFHHVSTAYVCGLRTGTVREDELDVGQELGNDYERSKLQAEQAVRAAGFPQPPTIYRPSIIVGDSQTGFTTTFHGFYAVLRLTQMLAQALGEMPDESVLRETRRITLSGQERKNLVPVDWVSAAITTIFRRPALHGRAYHLVADRPVTTEMIRDVVAEVCGLGGTVFAGPGELENPSEIETLFYEHLKTYASYWRNDPTFDVTTIRRALPDLPCPVLDLPALVRLGAAALAMNFRHKDECVPAGATA